MRKSRFTEDQVIVILRDQEGGVATTEVCRCYGISSATFYAWKAKLGGLDVSHARRLKVLEEENVKPKRLLAEVMLNNAVLKEVAAKSGEARCGATGRRAHARAVRSEPTSGLRDPSR